jgi:hypothetical protein
VTVQKLIATRRPVAGSSPCGPASGPVLVPCQVPSTVTASADPYASAIVWAPSGKDAS